MRVLIDTNVVLDLLLDRQPFSEAASELFDRVEENSIEGFLGATTLTTLFYLAAKTTDSATARDQVRRLLVLCSVAPVDKSVLTEALDLGLRDFEDAVLVAAARRVDAQVLVTRNLKDFRKVGGLTIVSPAELVESLRLRS